MLQTMGNRYLSLVHRSPKLSRELEHELAVRWRTHGDPLARDELVRCNLRHVVAVARRFGRETAVTFDELIAEGNFGLLHALGKFDPEQGTRFVTYAVYWIRAYMSQYLIRSRSLVSTGLQSKRLWKVRRERARAQAGGPDTNADARLAEELALSPEQLRSLVERLDVRDVPWDLHSEEVGSGCLTEAAGSPWPNAEDTVLAAEARAQLSSAVSHALSTLDEREQYIVERRLMACSEEELSLAEIGRQLCVSRERARQLEARAMRKLRSALKRLEAASDWLADCGRAA
jgi:RNA polymerase sigma-32 factor